MHALLALAAEWDVSTADAEGYDLGAAELRRALVAVLEAKRDEVRRIVDRLADKPGSPCPNLFRGELRAAEYALRVIERDLASLQPRKTIVEATGVEIREAG